MVPDVEGLGDAEGVPDASSAEVVSGGRLIAVTSIPQPPTASKATGHDPDRFNIEDLQ
jgi:hypothetical protein